MAGTAGLATGRPGSPYVSLYGLQDLTRVVPGELSEDDLRGHIHALTDLGLDKISLTVAMEPFSSSHPQAT